ncbi:MAG TPA: helix-turn-helix domain-containing protein [Nitrososphaeraceae archaeon]|jgi:DNA-binding HxlR family transcriptional regulator|nr:helix-turn-helix domain-containing protein [Nitrososphaeraceae archaeon]
METSTPTSTIASNSAITQIINPSENSEMKCCPINNTFKLIGKKFTVLILRNMINGKQSRFNQLLNSIEKSNPKTLSTRLREMERLGLIKRKVYSHEIPIRIEYYPTQKALALQPILDMMAAYSMKYCSKDVFKDAKPREFKEIYSRDIAEIPTADHPLS